MKSHRKWIKCSIPVIHITAFMLMLSGCENQEMKQAYQQKSMEEANKAFINTYTDDFWNTHNIDAFDKYYSTDFKVHNAGGDQNREVYKQLVQSYFTAFPDLHITTDFLVAEGDKVAKVWTANSTHQADFMGIPETGKKIKVKGIEIFRIENGKISELWVCMDNLGMMQQMGVLPTMTN